jgi:hypothetical protein
MGEAPAPVPNTCVLDGVSALQTCPGVKRKARAGCIYWSRDEELTDEAC